MHYYSGTTQGFYNPDINSNIPSDAVEVSDVNYQALLLAQSQGKIIQPDNSGNPHAVNPTLSQEQQAIANAGAAIAGGIAITSTGTPALNGNYPVDPVTQAQVNGLVTGILVNGTFPNSATTLEWFDASGAGHNFSVAAFKNFATAFINFVTPIYQYAKSAGESGSIPTSNAITIP